MIMNLSLAGMRLSLWIDLKMIELWKRAWTWIASRKMTWKKNVR